MTDRILRTAVIGAGKMGEIHAKVYHQLPQSSLVAVVDIDEKSAKHLAKKYNCDYYTDCSQIFDKVDAVTISAPTIYHKQLAIPFIERGIACLIEKPLAFDVDEAQEIVALG
ncbi:MAG: Gfo/Idh/MocA family oxidoreductase, partial [Phycisphaerae bacterium]